MQANEPSILYALQTENHHYKNLINLALQLFTMTIAFIIIGLFAHLSTLMSLLFLKKWWVRIFDFPRLQIIVIQIISLAGILFFAKEMNWFNISVIILVFVSLLIQTVYVYPYFIFAPKEVPDGKGDPVASFSFLVSNVLISNRKSNKLIELVKAYQPDIFLAVETDAWWAQQLEPLDDLFEFSVKQPLENSYGMLLFSRIPLENARIEYIIKQDIPSIHAEITKAGRTIKIACIHPEPPAPEEADTSRPRDKEIVTMARRIKDDPAPFAVLGDLNDVAWSDTSNHFLKISGLKDPRKGRGFFNTFHAKIPFMRFALDHVFVSTDFKLIKIKRLPSVHSDHFPLYINCGIFK